MWQEFHDTLAHAIRQQLQTKLSPKYVALLNKYYAHGIGLTATGFAPRQTLYPDVGVVQPTANSGGTLTLERPPLTVPTLTLQSQLPHEYPILTVEIRDVAERRLVTVIEILSPVNKLGKGFDEYLDKRTELLQTATHLLEIDLLRQGKRLTFDGGELPDKPYFIFLSRFTHRPQTDIWAMDVRDSLPTVPVPLLPPDPDVPLDLQDAVTACFELVGYQRLLDYTVPPPPPKFSDDDATWIQAQVSNFTSA